MHFIEGSREMNFKKLPAFIAFMIFMSGAMTAIFTWMGLSSEHSFMNIWLPTWARAILLMMPIGFATMYLFDGLLKHFLPGLLFIQKSILLSLAMALVMDGLMTGLAAYQAYGFSKVAVNPWMNALASGLPFGIAISLLMTFLIKPRLERFMTT